MRAPQFQSIFGAGVEKIVEVEAQRLDWRHYDKRLYISDSNLRLSPFPRKETWAESSGKLSKFYDENPKSSKKAWRFTK